MSHVAHELHEEFPDAAETIHRLKTSDHHFARLAERYHQLNREIHRIDSGLEAASDERWEDLRKERVRLKDEIFEMLRDAG